MDLQQLRGEINSIDAELVKLFCRRMEISAAIGAYKAEHGLPVHDPAREEEIIQQVQAICDAQFSHHLKALYETIFTLSREHQNEVI